MFGKSGMGKRCLAHGKVGGKVNPSFLLGFHFPFPWERYNWETKQNLFSIPTQNKHEKGITISHPLGNDMGNDFLSNSFREPNGALGEGK
ncbi:hypothetical protein Pyn_18433 [Prunus yedoensis var. nudiflora]|uniref:Uncharacterized protein n=1 Tax=Prunus yedoensis var. nudiflora TaxID=2094558 RepID=A0A314XNH2_PRUYE|nr:hypothetical protein Pyn_18433 [Prunus yedoensis var. nudiflora]